MLDEHGVSYRYREYRADPLTEGELREILGMLGMSAAELLRTRDRAAKDLGLIGDEPEDELIAHMARHPTLVQRPIGVLDGRAALGRPPENLLALVE